MPVVLDFSADKVFNLLWIIKFYMYLSVCSFKFWTRLTIVQSGTVDEEYQLIDNHYLRFAVGFSHLEPDSNYAVTLYRRDVERSSIVFYVSLYTWFFVCFIHRNILKTFSYLFIFVCVVIMIDIIFQCNKGWVFLF